MPADRDRPVPRDWVADRDRRWLLVTATVATTTPVASRSVRQGHGSAEHECAKGDGAEAEQDAAEDDLTGDEKAQANGLQQDRIDEEEGSQVHAAMLTACMTRVDYP
jgi:hypothetical protein